MRLRLRYASPPPMSGNHDTPRRWDALGLLASGLCLVHCMSLPLLLAALPALGFLAARAFHVALGGLVLGLAALAFVSGYRRHRRLGVLALGLGGAASLGVAMLLPEGVVAGERWLTVVGSLVLVSAHLLNLRSQPALAAE